MMKKVKDLLVFEEEREVMTLIRKLIIFMVPIAVFFLIVLLNYNMNIHTYNSSPRDSFQLKLNKAFGSGKIRPEITLLDTSVAYKGGSVEFEVEYKSGVNAIEKISLGVEDIYLYGFTGNIKIVNEGKTNKRKIIIDSIEETDGSKGKYMVIDNNTAIDTKKNLSVYSESQSFRFSEVPDEALEKTDFFAEGPIIGENGIFVYSLKNMAEAEKYSIILHNFDSAVMVNEKNEIMLYNIALIDDMTEYNYPYYVELAGDDFNYRTKSFSFEDVDKYYKNRTSQYAIPQYQAICDDRASNKLEQMVEK